MGLRNAVGVASTLQSTEPRAKLMNVANVNPISCLCQEPDAGRWVSSYGGPRVSPYAQAIIDAYDLTIPFFSTVPFHLTGATVEQRNALTSPNQYDVLIIGAAINGFNADNGDSGQEVYLNVQDDKSKAPWVTPSPIGWAPLVSFGGVDLNPMPILKLPEAYFLPRHTVLEHNINNMTNSGATGGSITWVGVQLINIDKRPAPKMVTLPNGTPVGVGQRQPLWIPVALGREGYLAGVFLWTVDAGSMFVHYTPPLDCDFEVHDISGADIFSFFGSPQDPNNVLIKIADMGDREMWRPDRAPSVAVAGDFTQIYPALPFTKPYILKKGHRLQISVMNNNTSMAFENMFLTVRGVRLCEF